MADLAAEQRRLERVYSEMADGELQALAEDGASLTPVAVQVLTAEMSRRGLDIPVDTSRTESPDGSTPREEQVQPRDLVTIRTFQDFAEAMIAKGVLESAGIECFTMDENTAHNYFANTVGGIRMQVNRPDAEAATELLKQPIPESFEVEGVGSYQQPRCPQCHSADTTFQRLYNPVIRTYAWADDPVPEKKWTRKCKSCGYQWEDDRNGSNKSA
jgi:Putative prokaryotic signal transducing protein